MKTVILGGGNMGASFAQSFFDAHMLRKSDIFILERNAERQSSLRYRNWENIYDRPDHYLREAKLLVLAVKPQDAGALFESILPFVRHHHVILSIMAGVTMQTICDELNTTKVIRAMPNLPAQIGSGMTGFTALPEVTREELTSVQNLLNTTGKAIYFDEERMLDAVTAVSGSGPAYVYYFMDAMMQAAIKMGFTEGQADLFVWQTFRGAIQLQNQEHLTYQEWIGRVSSKGGTTEAAINQFRSTDIARQIGEGMQAALDRAVELGKADE